MAALLCTEPVLNVQATEQAAATPYSNTPARQPASAPANEATGVCSNSGQSQPHGPAPHPSLLPHLLGLGVCCPLALPVLGRLRRRPLHALPAQPAQRVQRGLPRQQQVRQPAEANASWSLKFASQDICLAGPKLGFFVQER